MKLRKITIPLAIGIISTLVACGGSSKHENDQNNKEKEIAEIETVSQELDSANTELDKEVADLENSLQELNSEN